MRKLETEIEVNADPATVWAILTDFEQYPNWNPFVRSIAGELKEGSTLTVHIKPEGGMGMTLTPQVVAAETNKRFGWKGKFGLKGIFDGHHEFIVEGNGNGSVRFIHREEFTGLLAPILWPMLEKNTRRGFEEMNAALKKRAEERKD